MDLKRACPVCGEEILYSSQRSLTIAYQKNSKCRSCRHKEIDPTAPIQADPRKIITPYKRVCPGCNEDYFLKTKEGLTEAIKLNSMCRSCSKKGNKNSAFGKIVTDDTRVRMSINKRGISAPTKEEISEILNPTLSRNCPQCGCVLTYSDRGGKVRAENENRPCLSCATLGERNGFYGKYHSAETRLHLSEVRPDMRGDKNPMYGKSFFDIWQDKFGEDEALTRLKSFKEKIFKSGRPIGVSNSWSGWYRGWFFRSGKELLFANFLDLAAIPWRTAESFDIPYVIEGIKRIYSPDLLVAESTLVEIKPQYLLESSKVVQAKIAAGTDYCSEHGLNFVAFDPGSLPFESLVTMREAGLIRLTETSEKWFSEICTRRGFSLPEAVPPGNLRA